MTGAALYQVMLVGLGGFIGSSLRFLTGLWVLHLTGAGGFPYGTLTVNVVGCLLIGLIGGLGELHGGLAPNLRAFVIAGVLGGFTTFSAFAYETLALAQAAQAAKALVNVVLQTGLGFTAAWIGFAGARLI